MKKRLEDQLIELAFDASSDSGVPQVPSDPESKRRLEEYRKMRIALSQLRDLPDHQLSTERLREALLHRGLRRRLSFPWQAVSYAASALALFCCAYVVGRNVRMANIQTKFMPGPAVAKLEPSSFPNWFSPDVNAQATAQVSLKPSPVVHRRSAHFARRAPSDAVLAFNSIPPSARDSVNHLAMALTPGHKPRGVIATSNELALAHSNSDGGSMIVINPTPDAETGLDTAHEVSGTHNVPVGG